MNEPDNNAGQTWRAAVQRTADDLDMTTQSQLNQARQRALAQLDAPGWRRAGIWLPAGSVTALALLAALLWWQPAHTPEMNIMPLQAQDMEILLSGEELELYADLDFYFWLEIEADAG